MTASFLENRVKQTGGDPDAFLRWLGVGSFHHVPKSRLEEAHAKVDAKERKATQKA